MTEQWLTLAEYARKYGMSDQTVRRRIKSGKIPAVLKDMKYYIRVTGHEVSSVDSSPYNIAHEGRPHRGHEPMPGPRTPPAMHNVVKSHPRPQNHQFHAPSFTPEHGQPQGLSDSANTNSPIQDQLQHGSPMIPQSLRTPLSTHETSLVDTRALLAFCEAFLKKMQEVERRQVEKFKAKLEVLEVTLMAKDQEIKSLRQQTEDLQVLVSILEKGR